MTRLSACLAAILMAAGIHAATYKCKIAVDAGAYARSDTLVEAPITLPDKLAGQPLHAQAKLTGSKSSPVPAQIVQDGDASRVCFHVPAMAAGETQVWRVTVRTGEESAPGYTLQDTPGEYLDCLYGGRPVTRLMYFTYSPDTHEDTKKVFHHVFSPAGDTLITKGGGGLYPHHRGLFIGWNKTVIDGKGMDFWHLPKPPISQRYVDSEREVTGPVLGSETAVINWIDPNGEPVIEEHRTLSVIDQTDSSLLLDWSTELKSLVGDIELGGDMHHAGFQYRAHNEVSERESETHYLHPPADADLPGAPAIPWSAMSYALGDTRYTVAHMNHPINPEPTDYSDEERQYGRFGAYFTCKLTDDEPLKLRYRLYIVEGEPPTPEEIHAKYIDFAAPPTAE